VSADGLFGFIQSLVKFVQMFDNNSRWIVKKYF
jgi:hypothetical protein